MAQGWVYEDDSTGWRTMVNGDLPTSGVTAATYGDATHVGAFTVNAQGIITAANNVLITGGGGGAGTGLVKLFSTTLGATGALDTGVNGIASGHGTLYIVATCRSAAAVSVDTTGVRMTFNGDAAGNYDEAHGTCVSTGWSGAVNAGPTGFQASTGFVGNSATGSYASTVIIEVPSYDNTSFYKSGHLRVSSPASTAANLRETIAIFGWRNTAAINQFTIDCTAHFIAGSTMTVYGTE